MIVELKPAEHKDDGAPFVEELESPVVNGGGVDLKEVFEDSEPGGSYGGHGGHVLVFQCIKVLLPGKKCHSIPTTTPIICSLPTELLFCKVNFKQLWICTHLFQIDLLKQKL